MKFAHLTVSLALAAPALALAAPQYVITDLGVIAPAIYSQTFGISSSGGYIVGRGLAADGDSSPWPAFVWSAGTGMVAQGNLAGRNYAAAYGINNTGVAVGVSALTGSGSSPLPVIWSNGTAAQLAMPAGVTAGRAYDINDNGIAVGSVGGGSSEVASIYNTKTGQTSMITALSSAGSYMQTAFAINNSGIVVGSGVDASGRGVIVSYDSTLKTLTEIAPLPYAGFNSALAFDISENGFVVGSSGNNSQAFIWSAGTGMVGVTLPAISSGGSLRSVNDAGWAVGNSGGTYSNPFLYADGATYLIKDLIVDASGWNFSTTTSASAEGIGNNGVIVGTAKFNGVEHAYMLTAVPEPGTYALMLGGLLTVGFVARRRAAAQA